MLIPLKVVRQGDSSDFSLLYTVNGLIIHPNGVEVSVGSWKRNSQLFGLDDEYPNDSNQKTNTVCWFLA